jgi:hypothetical protein
MWLLKFISIQCLDLYLTSPFESTYLGFVKRSMLVMEYFAHNQPKTFKLKMKCKIQLGISKGNYGT